MKAGITTLQILTLSNLKGVGIKSILKVGNHLLDCNMTVDNNIKLVEILERLKIKKKK